MQPIDLNLLVALDALLQAGSVTGAARRLGLSTPAASHALARVRERLGDPILVRAGRQMVLTPRAVELKPRVHSAVAAARQALEPERPFVPAELRRSFVVHATDYVLGVLGTALDRILLDEAPHAVLRFVPNGPDDAAKLRQGGAELAIGIYGELPQELRTRQLLTDRFVCVMRRGHPQLCARLSLRKFVALPHIQVAPRGKPGGYVDDVLRERGLERKVVRAVPYFTTALELAAQTDYLLTISERMVRGRAAALGLEVRPVPLPLRPYALSLLWHPRFDGDPAHRYLREAFVRAAQQAAGDAHDAPRRRLDPTDPTSGESRSRPGRARA